jgi:hypothetical protein
MSAFDFVRYCRTQITISRRAFGPPEDPRAGTRLLGILAHLRKELIEVEQAPQDPIEWADLIILAIDGAWRQGITPEVLVTALDVKQRVNCARRWPDWRTASPSDPIEHDRSGEGRPV